MNNNISDECAAAFDYEQNQQRLYSTGDTMQDTASQTSAEDKNNAMHSQYHSIDNVPQYDHDQAYAEDSSHYNILQDDHHYNHDRPVATQEGEWKQSSQFSIEEQQMGLEELNCKLSEMETTEKKNTPKIIHKAVDDFDGWLRSVI